VSEHGPHDVVGRRVLVGVQMVDISRLSAHPVPLTDRGLITVAGQGPKDSNGAGKSSFIAALSLLHADEQWRLAGGAPGAAELLFTAELAAQEARWANADRGYVIGVFADPGAITVEELDASVLSVWLRINRRSPYLNLRWTDGLHVPTGTNDAERAAGVHDLWDALPASNGRDDFHAGRLASVLYGGRVRCVSFLSTSVRATPTPNLLAQALNELTPTRIFDALATLTGLDRELEREQTLRSAEHERRTDVCEAEQELARWQREMDVIERGIAHRAAARDVLAQAGRAWRSRCARHLLDGVDRVAEIRHARSELEVSRVELRERVAEADEQVRTLADDEEFATRFRATEDTWRVLREQERDADTRHRRTVERLEDLTGRLRDLRERAHAADGRDTASALAEQDAAQQAVEDLLAARGAAAAEQARADEQLLAAEAGDDVAVTELALLARAGVAAAPVLDVLAVDDDQRAVWEPRLALYREAVVVAADQLDVAVEALAGRPGAVLVVADAPTDEDSPGSPSDGTLPRSLFPGPSLPRSTDPRFPLDRFVSALISRADDARVDAAAGVVVLGGADRPVTGRLARVAAARTRLAEAAGTYADLERRLSRARTRLTTAGERVAGATAAAEADEAALRIDELRELAARLDADRAALEPSLRAAEAAHAQALGDSRARADRIAALRDRSARVREDLHRADELDGRLDDELTRLDVATRTVAWGTTVDKAHEHLLALPDDEQLRSATDWGGQTCQLLDDVVRRCFADDTPPEEMPAQLRALLVEQRWRRLPSESRLALVPDLTRALHTHLTLTTAQDEQDQRQIDVQRAERTQDLTAAQAGLIEAQHSSEAYRTVLAQGIRAKLTRVGEEFDRLDREYGGYGAGLDCPEPEPPLEPERPWRWAVTPKWRRAEGQRMSGYNLRGNTAQMDEKAVKLVCAAALAGGDDRPLLLILDELGRNLGKQHRREAVALFERIGRDRNITVIGALQDDMERYAIEASNLYVKLRRSSDAAAYNDAPVVLGDEPHADRIALLRDWMSAYRPSSTDASPSRGADDAGAPGLPRGGIGSASGRDIHAEHQQLDLESVERVETVTDGAPGGRRITAAR
jgi:hypothetical protein